MPRTERAVSKPLDAPAKDDIVLPFQLEGMTVRGRLARLGPAVDQVLTAHDYPEPVSVVLGEALVLAAMLGAALKFDGIFTVQAQGNGPVSMLVADYETDAKKEGRLRGYAAFDKAKLARLQLRGSKPIRFADLLGEGSLALTIDPRLGRERYQGIVPLEGDTLSACARGYFDRSEQIPTFVALAVARYYRPKSLRDGQWRAGGLLVQSVAQDGGFAVPTSEKDQDDWIRASLLAQTIASDELVDPTLAPNRLLLRLFHEDGVRVFDPFGVVFGCRCSRGKVEDILTSYSATTLSEMADDGRISARCEFCNSEFVFELGELASGAIK